MSDLITHHADAAALLRGALPGARVETHAYPRRREDEPDRSHERLWRAELGCMGRATGVVCGSYRLPVSAAALAAYARGRVRDALLQRAGRESVGESFMGGTEALPDVSRTYEVRA